MPSGSRRSRRPRDAGEGRPNRSGREGSWRRLPGRRPTPSATATVPSPGWRAAVLALDTEGASPLVLSWLVPPRARGRDDTVTTSGVRLDGSSTRTPRPTKSFTFRVTSTPPCTRADAAKAMSSRCLSFSSTSRPHSVVASRPISTACWRYATTTTLSARSNSPARSASLLTSFAILAAPRRSSSRSAGGPRRPWYRARRARWRGPGVLSRPLGRCSYRAGGARAGACSEDWDSVIPDEAW